MTELELLKQRADLMGIKYKANIGVEALKKKIEDFGTSTEVAPLSEADSEQALRQKIQSEQMALVRCRIYNLNPSKTDVPGEFITVANRYLGTVRKYIPFGESTQEGYHIPKVLFDDLRGRQFQQITTKKIRGQVVQKTRMVPEYNLEVLPPLQKDELEDLAVRQAANQSFAEENF